METIERSDNPYVHAMFIQPRDILEAFGRHNKIHAAKRLHDPPPFLERHHRACFVRCHELIGGHPHNQGVAQFLGPFKNVQMANVK